VTGRGSGAAAQQGRLVKLLARVDPRSWWPSAEDRSRIRASTRLEWKIARRYLRSRRTARTASLNTVISIGGVAVGVTALIVVLGVMNGLRDDLRERILVANPHLRILTFGSGLRLDDWRSVITEVRKQPGVLAASPEVISQAGITAGAGYCGGGKTLWGGAPSREMRRAPLFTPYGRK